MSRIESHLSAQPRIRLFGRIMVEGADGAYVSAGPAKQACVLAVLALQSGRLVSVDTLIERVWDDSPPRAARAGLHSYVARLRKLLDHGGGSSGPLAQQSGGYVLTLEPEQVDVHLMRALAQRGGKAVERRDHQEARRLYRRAVELCHGEALGSLGGDWAVRNRVGLHQERAGLLAELYEVELHLGHHDAVLPELAKHVTDQPLDERLVGQYLLALCRCGRPADALTYYERTRERLAEELGADPSAQLQELHRKILTGASVLSAPPAASRGVPRQLPLSPVVFTGRSRELEQLTDALQAQRTGSVAIGGIGGVGKTWLALRWVQDNVERFPDGQLYVNLRGFEPSSAPVPAAVALRGFLGALGVEPDAVPADLEAQAGLYRSLLAERRMVIVLDNARDADQVRPLLPGSPSCRVLITSRDRLTSLVTTHGAGLVSLDAFQPDQARELLTRHLGVRRAASEPAAVDALVAHCAGLPLALGIVAARAVTHPAFPLAVLAEELRSATGRLDALATEDVSVNLRAVFATSHRALTPPAGRLFALLGQAPGPDIGLPATAALAALPVPRTRQLLAELEAAHLIQQHRPGRYRMHDLIGLFAAEMGEAPDTADALTRLIDFHVHTAFAANQLLDGPHTPFRPELGPPAAGCAPLRPADTAAALEWFATEHSCLPAVQALALEQGRYAQVWQLAWTLISYHLGGHHLQDYFAVWRAALTAAELHGDAPVPRALAHWRLGQAHAQTGEHAKAMDHLHLALALSEQTEDLAGQAHICRTLGRAWEQHGDDEKALDHAVRALGLYRKLDNPVWLANQLNAVGWMHAQLGLHSEARDHCQQALALFRADGQEGDAASTHDSLGYIAHHTGRHTEALDHYRQALSLFRHVGSTYDEADTLTNLGDTYDAMNRPDQAREAWEQALSLYETQRRPARTEELRNRLAQASAALRAL
ncbi:BTAD domain-containing putative transcriptional regulator [Streptomyces sp. SID3212]|uniref:AfsR/SARP family transcriptional regulator n=1 Tax=Streptomyces sp. SID3212 TaxID=2690259 RepID=UPI001F230458|nr:BTAD domain-containing putative transcriptional regulator [Streptomyces sp. SID3212]